MKTKCREHLARTGLLLMLGAIGVLPRNLAIATAPPLPPQPTGPLLWEITERAAHSSKWEASVTRLNRLTGKTIGTSTWS